MLNKSSYIWLLLLVICCWHCMACRKRDRSRDSTSSSSSSEDSSSSSEDSLPCKKRATCSDCKRNQGETDVDCGGPKCKRCGNTKICKVDCDCISGLCENNRCTPLCDFECKNNGVCVSRNNCTCTNDFTGPTCEIESTGLCLDNETIGKEPILLITFGNGSSEFSSSTPDHFHFSTTYQQQFVGNVGDGQFGLVNTIDKSNVRWHINAQDHSDDRDGYMYLVNADFQPGQFYNGKVNNLCIGLRYELSVYLANIHQRLGYIKPNVLFEVRSADGNELFAQLTSGDVAETDNLSWKKYGLSFTARTSSVNLLMISNAAGGAGNDLVIDDIALRVCSHRGSGFCPPK